MTRTPARELTAAGAAAALALVFFVGAVLRAAGAASGAAPGTGPLPLDTTLRVAEGRALSEDALQLAVDHDPFREERQRSAERYRLPSDYEPPPLPPPPPPAVPDFSVLGTAVSTAGSFAIVRVGDAPPRVLAVGDHLGGYRLKDVGPEHATMTNDERDVTVMVAAPAAQVAAQPVPVQRGGRRGPPGGAAQAERARAVAETIERLRAQGASPQLLQQVMRFAEENGGMLNDMEFNVQGGNLTVRTRRSPDDTVPQPQPRTPQP